MKKNLLFIATAALLAACSENEIVLPEAQGDGNPISFSAYTGEAANTRGVVEESTEITKVNGKGIGVFAFYQPAAAGNFNTRKFATPDFMYNQKVNCPTIADTWEYDPLKFWPNNTDDKLSFFAYAPYESDKAWDDLGISTDATASKIMASVPIYSEKTAMKDVLWTDPQLNKTKATTSTVKDKNIDNPIVFSFRHLLSRVGINVTLQRNTTTGYSTWKDDSTTITIDKIIFTNLADSYNYTCEISKMSTAGDDEKKAWWTASSTTQDIELSNNKGDFYEKIATIQNASPWNEATWNPQNGNIFDLLSYEKDGQQNSKYGCYSKYDYNQSYLFFAPQTVTKGTQQVTIVYTVKTTDPDNSANSSTITNTITKNLYDILPEISTSSDKERGFETGKAYRLIFCIGMNSVDIKADVEEWAAATDVNINTPANK